MTGTPRSLRFTSALASVVLLGITLGGCALIPTFSSGSRGDGTGGASSSELANTTWEGVDSDGDRWGLEFQSDGTVGLEYNGDTFDDAGDVWSQSGDTVTIRIGFDDGDVDLIGRYEGLDVPMETTGTHPNGTFTVSLERT